MTPRVNRLIVNMIVPWQDWTTMIRSNNTHFHESNTTVA
jgi:hypothetical protein